MRQTRAGRLRHRVQIQRRTSSGTDKHGAITVAWEDIGPRRFARVDSGTSREFVRLAEQVATMTHMITVRHEKQMLGADFESWRVLWHQTPEIVRTLELVGMPTDRDNELRETILMCRELRESEDNV